MSDTPQQPTELLKCEHETILRVIGVLNRLVARCQQGQSFDEIPLRKCVEFFRLFADACHHAKEEDLLFPLLEAKGIPREGGPIGVMLHEHQLARQHTRAMADALDARQRGDEQAEARFHAAAQDYIHLLRTHIFKEDNVLFNMADHVMSDADQASLCGQFCNVGCRSFDGKRRDELVQLADELEAQCPPD